MTKKYTAFWEEGMNNAEQEQRASELFSFLGHNENTLLNKHSHTYIFVPDPPTKTIDKIIHDNQLSQSFHWGNKGWAIGTSSFSEAKKLAPQIFNLWSDELHIFLFETPSSNISEMKNWIEQILLADSKSKIEFRLPEYKSLAFDWGERLIEEE